MAFAGGVFSRLYNWATEQASSPIEIAKLDLQEEDFAAAFTNCMLRDGTGLPTAHQDFNGKNLTNVGTVAATAMTVASKTVATIDSGSFTATFLGFSGSVSGTLNWYKVGRLVTLLAPAAISGTSNSISFLISGLPTEGTPPTVNSRCVCVATDNSLPVATDCSVGPDGQISLGRYGSSFTASGTKGVPQGWSITYLV